jgi:NADH-quinone oxidoreductase subunit N
MNDYQLISLELAVVLLAIGVLLADLWMSATQRKMLGYVAAAGVGAVLIASYLVDFPDFGFAFGKMYAMDPLAMFFKRFFLVAAIIVLLMAVDFSDRVKAGATELYVIILFALAGMMFCASANDFVLMFAALETITVSFYVLTSFMRNRLQSLEAGVKYLILGALSTGFTVFGIALVFGTANTMNFEKLMIASPDLLGNHLFLLGLLFILSGLGFKIAAFPFQSWAPDVYQGSPAPVTAFLAVGSKAAGFVLLLRLLFSGAPAVAAQWKDLLIYIAAFTILYGNLCAIPQRSLKRLLGYSSIGNAGYLLIGVAAVSKVGVTAVLFYLVGYLFTVLAAFTVISVVTRHTESDDIGAFSGLGRRSPLLAAGLTFAMVSLAGIPPLAGFFGKFMLLKAAMQGGAKFTGYYCLVGVAVFGVVVSLYYYFGVIRAMFWSREPADLSPIPVSGTMKLTLGVCMAAMLVLGVYWKPVLESASEAVAVFTRLR